MKTLGKWFMQGLVAVLPIALTLAILVWLGTTAESLLGAALRWALPQGWYVPGLGILAGLVVITATGILVNAYLFRRVLESANNLLANIPLVKTVFESVRDVARFAAPDRQREDIKRAVTLCLGDNLRVVGFVTNSPPAWDGLEKKVPVYVPMSYQIGGFTLLVSEEQLEPLDVDVQTAMRYVLTAGMADPGNRPERP